MAKWSEIAAIERAVDDMRETERENERLREKLRKAQQTIRELQYRDSARYAPNVDKG